jgi:hypothetical protein
MQAAYVIKRQGIIKSDWTPRYLGSLVTRGGDGFHLGGGGENGTSEGGVLLKDHSANMDEEALRGFAPSENNRTELVF